MNYAPLIRPARRLAAVFLLLGNLLAVPPVRAAEGLRLTEARSVALGEASVALESFRNPASFVYSEEQGRALFSFENRYGMKELSTYGAAVRYHFPFLQVGATFSRFGYERYNETFAGIDLSKRLFTWLGLGVRIRYANLYRSDEEGSDEAVAADLGVTFRPAEAFTVALLAVNLVKSGLNTHTPTEPLPFTLAAGISYRANAQFLACAEVEYIDGQTVRMKAGLEYFVVPQLPLRLGFTSSPLQPTFGLGYRPSSHWRFDLASSYHTTLGFAPSLSVEYCF